MVVGPTCAAMLLDMCRYVVGLGIGVYSFCDFNFKFVFL